MKAHTSVLLLAALYAAAPLSAALPDSVPYQGRIAVSGLNFTGTGQFKFAVYQQPAAGGEAALLWTNATGATTGALAEPATGVALPVTNGLYVAGLGDTAIPSMAALPASLEPANGQKTFVRVWFNDGTHGFQPLSPDTELRAVPFAREAASAANVGGIAAANLARLDSANHFASTIGITVSGNGPRMAEPAEGATVPVSGAGTRMMFLPGYGAFRAGTVSGTEWDADNVSLASVAMGYGTIASQTDSTAMGYYTTASGDTSTAMGWDTTASGESSTAMGRNTTASGESSAASGYFSAALGWAATAMGWATTASGDASTSMGSSSAASGFGSTAMGVGATARSYAETSLGVWNTYYTPISESSWEALDRLFVIGNGTWGVPSDALMMLKNGATTLNGTLQINHVDGVAVVGSGPSADAIASGATVPVSGAGTRMMFLPGYGAFRAGSADGTEWDAAYIGRNSIAMGKGTTASGFASTAMGSLTNASGDTSTAMGESTTASGPSSTAMGVLTTARSFAETSLGFRNTEYSPFDAGSWDPRDRLFVVGNGYDAPSDALVMLKNGDTTFSGNVLALTFTPTSDRNRKTDIVPADTAAVLAGVATLPIATWKFKAETVTHLGPMAQDFAAAFHLGATDTGIATVDADGVALAAIQELNKRVNSLSQENAALKSEVGDLKTRLSAIEAKLVR